MCLTDVHTPTVRVVDGEVNDFRARRTENVDDRTERIDSVLEVVIGDTNFPVGSGHFLSRFGASGCKITSVQQVLSTPKRLKNVRERDGI